MVPPQASEALWRPGLVGGVEIEIQSLNANTSPRNPANGKYSKVGVSKNGGSYSFLGLNFKGGSRRFNPIIGWTLCITSVTEGCHAPAKRTTPIQSQTHDGDTKAPKVE